MAVIIRKVGVVFGSTHPIQAMVAFVWKGIQVFRHFAEEILMPITERLIESNKTWVKSSLLWREFNLLLRQRWDGGAGALGSAHEQEKIMCVSERGSIIKRSRGS